MAFVVENGTGLANANSYATVEEADAYFADRGITAWTWESGTPTAKQECLIRATDYIELRFASRFKGNPEFPDTPQALSFPRLDIAGYEGVPECLKRATYEYALRAVSGSLLPDVQVETNGLQLAEKRTKVGPIESEFKYKQTGAGSAISTFRAYPAADRLLRPLLIPGSNNGVYR